MASKSSIYLSNEIRTKLRCPPRGQSAAVSAVVDRYDALLGPEKKRIAAAFTEGEMNAMRNACNGTLWEGWSIRGGVLANIQDSLNEELESFGADRVTLEGKLAGLSPVAQYALVEEIEAWWEQQGAAETEPEE